MHGLRARPHLRVKEARGDDVHARELAPLAGQRLPEVRDERLRAVVDRLVGGDVYDVGAHAGGENEVAGALALEDFAGVFGGEDDAVDWGCLAFCSRVVKGAKGRAYRLQTSACGIRRGSARGLVWRWPFLGLSVGPE